MIASSLLTSLRPILGLGIFTTRQLATLLLLHMADRQLSFPNVCADLAISKPALTRSLDRLTTLGFVERSRSDGDRRKTFVAITKRGRALVRQLEGAT
jgi:DNA-binding MarR family transcriptional regulator